LQEEDFQKLIGRHPTPDVKAFSADVVANVLDKLHLDGLHGAVQDVIHKAERNKAFRDGCYSALRCVAMDGWEPFGSYDRHCPHCLVVATENSIQGFPTYCNIALHSDRLAWRPQFPSLESR